TWDGSALQTQFNSDTTLTAKVPAELVASLGSRLVAVTAPAACAPQSAPPCTIAAEVARLTIGGVAPGFGVRILRGGANDLGFDPVHGLLFASSSNAVAVVDPIRPAISRSVTVANAGVLAPSDDGKYLYTLAGLGPVRILSFDLPDLTARPGSVDASATLGSAPSDLQVAPGASGTLAVGSGI